MARLDDQIFRLETLSPAALQAAWAEAYGNAPPLLSPALLRMGIAWRLQEAKHGGLPASIRRELQRIAAGEPAPTRPVAPDLRPGTLLVREWQGRTISVQVEEKGFLFDGQLYASLSGIAKTVTGAHWSGPRFFGITARA
ncbi:DUF2924 domain-containing protein [Sphingomonas sp. AP4-R1]|uniref:DUF2924 domain-containing protein n=1 Tax=Sphingomonas sp. AP4-R1 TaxID=2735134 RepID=UPI001493A36D|nr:DUF2924 domain-containing protein [Sphingomonas sp. AP4-R1]QJU59995.1 DUF2924 domain-containing protein [Sphingomonas sp. AP4-R1]